MNDILNSNKDLKWLGIKSKMHLRQNSSLVYMPIGWYILSKTERVKFCEQWLMKKIKLLVGYVLNLTICEWTNNWKIIKLKSYVSHVFL